jgi:hypothetical protein
LELYRGLLNDFRAREKVVSRRDNAEQSAKELAVKATKKDLVKSVLIALAIITLEVVLYLAWNK